jgi:hypothetical protein
MKCIDICLAPELSSAVGSFRPDVIFHLGARTDLLGESREEYSANTDGVQNSSSGGSSGIRTADLFRFIAVGGRSAISHDQRLTTVDNTLRRSKVETERSIGSANRSVLVLFRPTSIWGPCLILLTKTSSSVSRADGMYTRTGTSFIKALGLLGTPSISY